MADGAATWPPRRTLLSASLLKDFLGFRGIQCEGLLPENVLASSDCFKTFTLVRPVWGANIDTVHVRVVLDFLVAAVDGRLLAWVILEIFGYEVVALLQKRRSYSPDYVLCLGIVAWYKQTSHKPRGDEASG